MKIHDVRYTLRMCFLFFGFCLFISFKVYAQTTPSIDSLEKLLRNADSKDEATILNELASEYISGNLSLDKAMEYASRAKEKSIRYKNKKEEARSLHFIGSCYSKKNEYKKALFFYKKSLTIREKIDDKDGLAKTLNGIASVYEFWGDFDKALIYNKRALEIKKYLVKKNRDTESIRGLGITLSRLGNNYFIRGKYNEALEHYTQAKKLFVEIGFSTGITSCLNNCGIIYENLGKFDKAIKFYQEALTVAESDKNEYDIANAMNNIGNVYSLLKRYNQSIEYYQKALEKRMALGDQSRVAHSYNNLGIIYTRTQDFEKALQYYFKALKINEEMGNKPEMAQSLFNIGEVNDSLKKYNNALIYYKESLTINEEINKKSGVALSLLAIGNVLVKQEKHDQAMTYLNKSLAIYKEMKEKGAMYQAYQSLSNAYETTGNFKEAIRLYKMYSSLKDTVINENMNKQIAELQTQYETEKSKQEIKILHQQNVINKSRLERQNFFFIAGGILFVMIIMLVLLLYNRYLVKTKANVELEKKNILITRQKEEITDSILYAKRIQTAILPPPELINDILPQLLVLFKPRDIVSGDFFWIKHLENQNKVIITAVDCTGHGVPGACMSMLGVAFLNEIVNNIPDIHANLILNELRHRVIESLHQTGRVGESKDGMDIALCVLDTNTQKLEFSGANNPMYMIRDNKITITKADKMPIGIHTHAECSFTQTEIQLRKEDRIYLFSDGYADQFGGPEQKKFKYKQLQELLLSINNKPMDEQQQILDEKIMDWKGSLDQVDDILIVGFQI